MGIFIYDVRKGSPLSIVLKEQFTYSCIFSLLSSLFYLPSYVFLLTSVHEHNSPTNYFILFFSFYHNYFYYISSSKN